MKRTPPVNHNYLTRSRDRHQGQREREASESDTDINMELSLPVLGSQISVTTELDICSGGILEADQQKRLHEESTTGKDKFFSPVSNPLNYTLTNYNEIFYKNNEIKIGATHYGGGDNFRAPSSPQETSKFPSKGIYCTASKSHNTVCNSTRNAPVVLSSIESTNNFSRSCDRNNLVNNGVHPNHNTGAFGMQIPPQTMRTVQTLNPNNVCFSHGFAQANKMLPKFDGNNVHPMSMIEQLEQAIDLLKIPENQFKFWIAPLFTGEAKIWADAMLTMVTNFQEFKTLFLDHFWGGIKQLEVRQALEAVYSSEIQANNLAKLTLRMTILPAKRTTAGPEDKNDNSANGNTERARREHSAHSSGINESSKSGTRRPFRRSASPETTDHCLRKRFKESSKPPRRKQTRERKNNRVELPPEESHDTSNNAPPTEQIDEVDVTSRENDNKDSEDGTGFNSEDEYTTPLRSIKNVSDEDWTSRDALFARCIAEIGYEIKQINEDGACLFRAIADQIFGDQELHYMVRTSCMDYIVKNRDFFAAYVTEDFDKYVARKRKWNVHGNHLEIQAMSEMYNRTIEVYCYQIEPINIFNGPTINADEPIRLSYHRMCHYNSISNPNKPSVGVGLGLPAYHTIDLNRRRMVDAVRASEELLIEQTMLEDKLKATDWEATNEALEEEVARESYIQYFRDAEKRLKPQGHAAGSSSTITSAVCSSPRSSTRRGSASPKGSMSPKGSSSPKSSSFTSLRLSPRSSSTVTSCQPIDYSGNSSPSLVSENAEMHFSHIPVSNQSTTASSLFDYDGRCKLNFDFGTLNEGEDSLKKDAAGSTKKSVMESDLMNEDDWDDGIMAQVLAESRKTYLDDLKKNTKKLGSPGPSTSR